MSLAMGNMNYGWNYSDASKPGHSLELTGTVVAIQNVQALDFGSRRPKTWPDGNPVLNLRLWICGPNGGLRTFTTQRASKAQQEGMAPSAHVDLLNLANQLGGDLIGQTISIRTEDPPQGIPYGSGRPRPWYIEHVADQGPFEPSNPLPVEATWECVLGNGQRASSDGKTLLDSQGNPIQAAPPVQPVQPMMQQVPVQPAPQVVPVPPQATQAAVNALGAQVVAVQQPVQAPAQQAQQVIQSDIPF